MPIRTLLFAASQGALAKLSGEVAPHSESLEISSLTGGIAELGSALLRGEVDLAVAHLPHVTDSDLSLIESALVTRPDVGLVLVTNDTSSDFLLRAMRAGVREIVSPDAPSDAFVSAIWRQTERLVAMRGGTRKGNVIAFMPAKGGSGATFLATNLAYALSLHGQRVAVLDMNLQFGDVALFVSDQRPTANIADVARGASRLDGELLESSMMKVADRMWVLAAPESPERSVEVKPEVVERIIAVARTRYDYVILDVGRILESVSIRALDEAESIYVVLQAALPTLHGARQLISVLNGLGYGRDKLKIVVNRADKNSDIGVGEVAKALGLDVARQVPNSYTNVVHSINHGIPIVKNAPKDPVSRVLVQWAGEIAPSEEKNSSFLRRMFGARS